MLEYAKRIAFYPKTTVRYLKREGSITTTYQSDFEKDIWYIDERARKFLGKMQNQDKEILKNADDLLCRNIVVYLFSIMSKKIV